MDNGPMPAGWRVDRFNGKIMVTSPGGKAAAVIPNVGTPFIRNTFGATPEEAQAVVARIQSGSKISLGTVNEALTRAGEKTDYVIGQLIVVEGNNSIVAAPSGGKTPTVHHMLTCGFSGEDFLRYSVENKIRRCLYYTAEGEKLHGRALQRYGLGDVLLNMPDRNDRYRAVYSERSTGLSWSEVVEQGTEWLTAGVTTGDPCVMVVEIMTDWLTDLGEEGENDAVRITQAMSVIKAARDQGVTPLLQWQTVKS